MAGEDESGKGGLPLDEVDERGGGEVKEYKL